MATTDQEGALWIPAANYWEGRNGYQPHYVIIHGTAGGSSAVGIANYFALKTTEASTNYIIDRNGDFVQCVREMDSAWANGVLTAGHDSFWNASINPNWISISIEHVKPSTDNSDELTEAQKQTSFRLIKAICQRWSIPMRRADANGGITSHSSIDPVNRSGCPGSYPWSELWAFLGEDEVKILAANETNGHFTEVAPDRWRCATPGHEYDVACGMLDFYRKVGQIGLNGLTLFGLPCSNEIAIAGHPKATLQRFERAVLAYNPDHSIDNPPGSGQVFLLHLYDGGVGTDPIVATMENDLEAAHKQIEALKQQLAANTSTLPTDLQNKLVVLKNDIVALLPAQS
jgi:N-acetyl-anhydromuramyl-L-alanine amidase AmpD